MAFTDIDSSWRARDRVWGARKKTIAWGRMPLWSLHYYTREWRSNTWEPTITCQLEEVFVQWTRWQTGGASFFFSTYGLVWAALLERFQQVSNLTVATTLFLLIISLHVQYDIMYIYDIQRWIQLALEHLLHTFTHILLYIYMVLNCLIVINSILFFAYKCSIFYKLCEKD